MTTLPIVLLAAVFAVILMAYCASPRLRQSVRRWSPLVSLLSMLAALSVFVQLFYSVHEFNMAQEAERQRAYEEDVARLSSFETEISIDLEVCGLILAREMEFSEELRFPHNRFHYLMVEDVLKRGRITDGDLRRRLYVAYHRMRLINNTIESVVSLMQFIKLSSDEGKTDRIAFILDQTKKIQSVLQEVESQLPDLRTELMPQGR